MATRFQPQIIAATAEQQAIQSATDKTVLVEANAGAAKTTTLALRMAESWSRGTAPELFLALTHTDTACDALKHALKKIGVPYVVAKRFRIQTFEDFCTDIHVDISGVKVPVILKAEELKKYVWQAILRVENNDRERWKSDLQMPNRGDNGVVERFIRVATRLKGTMLDTLTRDENAVNPDYANSIGVDYIDLKIFLAYEKIRKQEFSESPLFRSQWDATYDLAQMFYEGESVANLTSWPKLLQVLMVDEMHDMNQAMFIVLQKLLNSTQCFFTGVGDRDQVIYESTGAEARFMLDEIEIQTSRKVKRYLLTHSFRFANSLAIKAARIADKPYSSKADHETKISLMSYKTQHECAGLVVKEAENWASLPKTKMDEFAILLRHSHQSVELENELLARDIRYVTSGFDSYLMRPEVLFVRGLLAVAVDDLKSLEDIATRERVLQALLFFSGSKIEVEGREHESQEDLLKSAIRASVDAPGFLTTFFEGQILRNADPSMKRRLEAALKIARGSTSANFLKDILDALEIDSIIRDVLVSKQRQEEARGNIFGMRQAANRYNCAADYFLSLNSAEAKQLKLRKKTSASLLLASIENVKGLEFDHVVLPYLEKDVFPKTTGTYVEEKNMFYVGITRARRHLTLLAKDGSHSSFLEKAGYRPTALD